MPIPLVKRFDGKIFKSTRYTQSKREAQSWAKDYRKQGKEARVTQLGKSARTYGVYRNYWIVWVR